MLFNLLIFIIDFAGYISSLPTRQRRCRDALTGEETYGNNGAPGSYECHSTTT
jgi:hypothetical protein